MIDLYELSIDLSFEPLQNYCLQMIPSLITIKNFEKTFDFIYCHPKDEMEPLLNFFFNFYIDHSNQITFSNKKNRIIFKGRQKVLLETPKIDFQKEIDKVKEILFKTKEYYDQILISSDDFEIKVHKSVVSQFDLFHTFFNEKVKMDYNQKTLNLFLELIYLRKISIAYCDIETLIDLYPLLDQNSMNENTLILKEVIQSKITKYTFLKVLEFYVSNQINDDKFLKIIEEHLNNSEIEELCDAFKISKNNDQIQSKIIENIKRKMNKNNLMQLLMKMDEIENGNDKKMIEISKKGK